ncbi:MAG: class I SAM-dependent methyltransferase [Actinomycetota bacterium]|nr:class I SAM-dependent methyltransferase [Actinomycetota bacterium]
MRWTAQNVRLGDDEFAFGEPSVGAAEMVAARLIQLGSDLLGPLEGLRILDLACLEGLYGLEFAMHGAEVVAIEGREENAKRVRYAAERLSPPRFELHLEDVRDLSPKRHGTFDLTLCLGILYHLDADDVLKLAQAVYDCTERVAIFRTAIGLSGDRMVGDYRGFEYAETKGAWASIGNRSSFWPTKASLLNLLTNVGFTSVMEVLAPPVIEIDGAADGTFLVATKGASIEVLAAPPAAAERYHTSRWPENHTFEAHPAQGGRLARRFQVRSYWRKKMRRT